MTIINTVKSLTTFSKQAITAVTLSLTLASGASMAQQATNLDDLLSQLEQGKIAQSKQNKAREAEFKAKVNQQQAMLNDIKNQSKPLLFLL